jgi:hypothetical protein
MNEYLRKYSKYNKYWQILLTIIYFAIVIYVLNQSIMGNTPWWLSIFVSIGLIIMFVAYRVFGTKNKREEFKMILGYAETKIWGKPLEKEYWNKGELKKTKVRLVWKKKEKMKSRKQNSKKQ